MSAGLPRLSVGFAQRFHATPVFLLLFQQAHLSLGVHGFARLAFLHILDGEFARLQAQCRVEVRVGERREKLYFLRSWSE